MKKFKKNFLHLLDGPLLATVKVAFNQSFNINAYPFCLPLIKNLTDITFPTAVTFFVGENGSGKSTLLEAIAQKAGFGPEGGSKNINFTTASAETVAGTQCLADCFTLSWRHKPRYGYFFRAESFFTIANYIDYLARECGGGEKAYAPYGGSSLHAQSHGESFLSFFQNTLGGGGFFIFDEPEAALSPQRQLALLSIIHQQVTQNHSQFIIATHSPILLAYPGATIYSCDGDRLRTIEYKETDHYQITRRFLEDHEGYLQYLFQKSE
jgi:predicted ATPase